MLLWLYLVLFPLLPLPVMLLNMLHACMLCTLWLYSARVINMRVRRKFSVRRRELFMILGHAFVRAFSFYRSISSLVLSSKCSDKRSMSFDRMSQIYKHVRVRDFPLEGCVVELTVFMGDHFGSS